MKVRDLVEKLKQFDPDDEVFGGLKLEEDFFPRYLSIDGVTHSICGYYGRVVLIDMEDR